jgi:hypothetical protein
MRSSLPQWTAAGRGNCAAWPRGGKRPSPRAALRSPRSALAILLVTALFLRAGPPGDRARAASPDGATGPTGSGYAPARGVYLGGIDMSGGSGSQYWISNNPPPYAQDIVSRSS